MPDLSIIIPIYNTPIDRLMRCFSSLESLQGFSWEAILVDDGSGETTGTFCRKYAEENANFRYFHKENGGVSSARNFGLDQAQGKRILLSDADDMVLGAAITPELVNAQADMVVFDILLTYKGTSTVKPSLPVPAGPVDRSAFLGHLLSSKDLNGPGGKLFRTDLIREHALKFNTDFVTGEDWLFVTEYSERCKTFHYVNTPSYNYRREDASSKGRLRRFPDTMLQNHIAIFEKKRQVMAQSGLESAQLRPMEVAATSIYTEDLFNFAADFIMLRLYTKERKQAIRSAVAALKDTIPALPKKSRLKGQILLHFPLGLYLLALARAAYLKIRR